MTRSFPGGPGSIVILSVSIAIVRIGHSFHIIQRELGLSLTQWRQRLRVVRALPRLEAGDKVESIALDLGYGSASAFIAMFRRLMAVTPDEYRRTVAAAPVASQN